MSKPVIAVLLELILGYFLLPGIGWIYAGDVLRGILILVGVWILATIIGVLVVISLGILSFLIPLVYIAIPIISAIFVYQFASERYRY